MDQCSTSPKILDNLVKKFIGLPCANKNFSNVRLEKSPFPAVDQLWIYTRPWIRKYHLAQTWLLFPDISQNAQYNLILPKTMNFRVFHFIHQRILCPNRRYLWQAGRSHWTDITMRHLWAWRKYVQIRVIFSLPCNPEHSLEKWATSGKHRSICVGFIHIKLVSDPRILEMLPPKAYDWFLFWLSIHVFGTGSRRWFKKVGWPSWITTYPVQDPVFRTVNKQIHLSFVHFPKLFPLYCFEPDR